MAIFRRRRGHPIINALLKMIDYYFDDAKTKAYFVDDAKTKVYSTRDL